MSVLKLRTGTVGEVNCKAFFEHGCALLMHMRPDDAQRLGGTFSFILEGEGGGAWTLDLSALKVRHVGGQSDLVVRATAADFLSLTKGQLDSAAAFRTGRLRCEGDPALLGKFAEFLDPPARPPAQTNIPFHEKGTHV
jgi:hypothetical protein